MLDSLVRAKKILKLLGIPYSEIGASCESSIKSQKTSQSSGYTPDILGQQNSKNCLDSRNLKATGVRGLLSQSVASEIKMLLAEWYGFRLESPGFDSFHSALRRCTDSASLSETLMLFHRLDVSVMSMGVLGGQGIGSKIRDERAKNAKASKSTSPKEPSNWWSSSSPSSSFSPPPARMRSDVDGRKRESRKLQPLNKIPPQDLEGTSHSSYESPHALPRYVSLEIRNRSQWNQSHSSSYFSFSTPYHSDIFSLPSPQSKDMYKSSIPSNLYAIEMEESSRCKEMEAFMELWILDPRSVKEALRLSYLILEYARLLVVARGMATMTSDDVRTSESTGAGDVIPVVEHPLDRWRNELNAANIYKKEVLDVSSINASLSAPPLPPSNVRIDATVSASVDTLSDRRWNSMGMRSKFPSLNRVSASDLYSFLYPKKELNNKQLGDSRDRLLQCILLLLLSTRKEKTAESASRIVRGFLSATSSPSDGACQFNLHFKIFTYFTIILSPKRVLLLWRCLNYLPHTYSNVISFHSMFISNAFSRFKFILILLLYFCTSLYVILGVKDRPQGLQNRTTAVLQKHLHRVQVIGNKDSTANKRKDIEKQKNDCSIVLNSLKELCVSDVCYSNGGDNLFNSNNTDNQYGHRNGVSTTNKAYRKEVEQEKEKYLVHFEKACDDLFGSFPLSSRSKEYPKESESHFVAMALMDFIKCVRGVYRQRSLYRIDIHSWMGVVKNNCNPLCALLSLPSQSIDSKYTTRSRNHKLELTNKDEKKRHDERQVECCRLLLRTGVSAFYQDKTGRIPVVTVALGGDDNGPSMLLEMLSYLSSDDYSNDNSSSSSSNSSSYRDSVRDMNDQNLKPGTTPVPVRTHRYRILEGDDFKFLVWHVLMGCPGRDTSPSSIPIPCDTQIEEGNEGKYGIDSDKQDKNKVIDMSIPKRTTEKMNNATQKLLYAEYARRNRVQVAILSILLDCGFPGNLK